MATQKEQSTGLPGAFVARRRRDRGLLLFAILLLFLTTQIVSCAYYNTFYFARRYYRQAMQIKEQQTKSKGTSTAAVSSATSSSQISSLLDRAIEKGAKVISVYPKSKWVDDAVFLLGECYYEKHEYDKAIKKFGELSTYYPKSPLVPKAQFFTGMCYFGKNDFDQSSEILGKFIEEHPHSGDREAALYALGDGYFHEKKYVEALPYYRLLAGNRKSSFYFSTLLRIGECYFEQAKYDSSRVSLSVVAAKSSDDEQVLNAMIKIGDCLSSEKNFDAAINEYERSLSLADAFAKTSTVKLKMASAIAQKGEYKKAIEVYQSVVSEFPRTIQASEAQYRIGYIYEINLEELESAGAAYDKVKEHSSRSEFALLADMRGRGLAKLKEFSQTAQTSEGEKGAESAFLIAELSLFQLGKPDKAIEKYLGVEKDFPKTSFAPKSAYAAAYVFLYMKQDTAAAIEILKRVIENFPSSEYAGASVDILRKLGIEPPERKAVEPNLSVLPAPAASSEKKEIEEARKESGSIADTLKTDVAPEDTLNSVVAPDTLRNRTR